MVCPNQYSFWKGKTYVWRFLKNSTKSARPKIEPTIASKRVTHGKWRRGMMKRLYVNKNVKILEKSVSTSGSSSWTAVHHCNACEHLSIFLTLFSPVHLIHFPYIFSIVILFLFLFCCPSKGCIFGARARRIYQWQIDLVASPSLKHICISFKE